MLVSSNISFAKSVDEVDSKNNNKIDEKNLNEAKSEPHFDLPKKDAKEQCEEVERVYNICKNNISAKNWNDLHKCGNVYIKLAEVYYAEYGCGGGATPIITDSGHKIIGIDGGYSSSDTILFGKDMENLECIYSDDKKKYKEKLKISNIILEVSKCYVKEIKNSLNQKYHD
jgi:hypothetical protein